MQGGTGLRTPLAGQPEAVPPSALGVKLCTLSYAFMPADTRGTLPNGTLARRSTPPHRTSESPQATRLAP